MQTIYMEKPGERGKPIFHRYLLEGNKVTYEWGTVGGAVQSETRVFSEGKNIGKANEKSPEQCCFEDTITRARKKFEKGYQFIEGEDLVMGNMNKTVNLADTEIPKPMLALVYNEHPKKFDGVGMVYVQPKLDGNRCLINRFTGKMYSRSRKEISHLPEIGKAVVDACAHLPNFVEWVDGELYAHNMTFNDIQTALRRWKHVDKEGTKELQEKIRFHVFDVVADLKWSDRLDLLDHIDENALIERVPTALIKLDDLESFHKSFIDQGYEGIIIRKDGIGYEQKRSASLFKHKTFMDIEGTVIGYNAEEHDPSKLGSLIIQLKEGTVDARPAMTAEMKAHIWANQDKFLGLTATLKFQELDAKTGIPRFPVLKAFREKEDMS